MARRGRNPNIIPTAAERWASLYSPTHAGFYFIDETLGSIYLRVPTWCPFRLQSYYNGHISWHVR